MLINEERRTLLRVTAPLAAAAMLASLTPNAVAGDSMSEKNDVNISSAMNVQDLQVLFADLQPQLIRGSRTVAPEALSSAAAALAKVARILGIPMTFAVVPVAGQPGQLIPELAEFAMPETTFGRMVTSPFLEPRIVARLAASHRKTLVIAGFTTEVAVLQSALDGIAAGYAVQVPLDAIGSRSERTESPAIRQIEMAGGSTSSVLSLVTRWAPDLSRPPGSEIIKALDALR